MPEIAEKDLLQQFASDNYAGICPEAWRAMNAANRGRGSGRRLTFTVVQNTRGRSEGPGKSVVDRTIHNHKVSKLKDHNRCKI